MKRQIFFPALLFFSILSNAQSVWVGTTTPHSSALLEIQSSNKGMLPPRMSWQQIKAIPQPANGLVVYDNTVRALRMFDGKSWAILSTGINSKLNSSGGSSYGITPGPGSSGTIQAIAVGPDKSVYFGGSFGGFEGKLTLGKFTVYNPNSLFSDLFFGKYDSLGNIQWLYSLNSNNGLGNSFDAVTSIAVDQTGNMYMGGYFAHTLDFDPGPGVANMTADGALNAGFYAKYSPKGAFIWAQSFEDGSSSSQVQKLITDDVSLYVLSRFSGTVMFQGVKQTSAGDYDILFSRVQCSNGLPGTNGWTRRIGGPGSDIPSALSFAGSNILVGGNFEGTCDFGTISKTSAGGIDGFFASFRAASTLNFVQTIGGTEAENVSDLEVDTGGNIICAGYFSGACDFNGTASLGVVNSYGGRDGFIAKYTNMGSFDRMEKIGGAGHDQITDMAISHLNEVYALGKVEGTANIRPYAITTYNNGADAVFLKMPNYNEAEWVELLSGLESDNGGVLAIHPETRQLVIAPYMTTPFLDINGIKRTESFYLAWFYDE